MKKFFYYSALIVLFSACATVRPIPKSIITVIDYSVFTQRDIFVTESNSVNFEYKAIGSVFAEEIGGWVREDEKTPSKVHNDDYYLSLPNKSKSKSKKVYKSPDLQKSFSNLSDKLESINANGIINLKISSTIEIDKIFKVPVEKITITGMAIRR